MIKKITLALFCSLQLLSLQVFAQFTSELFEIGSGRKNKLFTAQAESQTTDGLTSSVITYRDPEQNVVLIEKSWLRGAQLEKMELEQKQMGQTASIEVKDKEVIFKKVVDGKTETATEKKPERLLLSANFSAFVAENWAQIVAGKELKFRWASWERMETVGFEIFKTIEGQEGMRKFVIVKMKPSSFLIAALVKPILFKFNEDGTQLIDMTGRAAVKQKAGSSWKDLDADITYKYN